MFKIAAEPIVEQELKAGLLDKRAGAIATFEGLIRNHNDGRSVLKLEYEAYEALAVKEAERILQECRQLYPIINVTCVHRVGILQIGDMAVWVGVSAAHRAEAFEACRFVIDQVKLRLPIWKKEHYTDGSAEWVNCQHLDHRSAVL